MATSRRGARWFCLAAVAAAMALLWLGGGAAHSADAAPTVTTTWPEPGALDIPLTAATDGSLSVTFSEPVTLEAGALEVACERSGRHLPAATGGPITFSFTSDRPFLPGENCLASVMAEKVADLDDDDPPNRPLSELDWPFRTAAEWPVINELDALTAEGLGEFVELYDGGRGHTDLSGLSLVFFGLDGSLTYLALGLDGYRTDEDGYFLVGDFGLAEVDLRVGNGIFLDEAVAVAIYDAPADTFPWQSPVPALEPIDAVVHAVGNGAAGPELMALLLPGEAALDENGRLTPALDSSQRCPDGAGLPRQTAPFILNAPTPGVRNDCPVDAPPEVTAVAPAPDARRVPLDAAVEIEFSEEVTLDDGAIEIACSLSGRHTYTVEGGGRSFRFIPDSPFLEREACAVTIFALKVADADGNDPPDRPTNDYVWDFTTLFTVAGNVLINEVDADTPGVDTAEFIELYDGGTGHTSLDGLSLLLFNGEDDRSYATLALDGYATDATGYFVAGNAAVGGTGLAFADNLLQNGPDAVALVVGDGLDYPDGTPVTAIVPFDAFIYARPNQADPGLQPLLEPGQPQVDENGRGNADAHSSQRCPNGTGGLRMTAGYKQNTPTPGAANDCLTDTPPSVQSVSPAHAASGISRAATLTVTFDEPVVLAAGWLALTCSSSGEHAYTTTGGPQTFAVAPSAAFQYSETCAATIRAARISDADADDPPDAMAADWSWSFATSDPPPNFILINEIDADTPGNDTAEFIELYDGGVGHTRLDGLALVFFNGNGDQSYRAIDLDGQQTDAGGHLVIGNAAVAPDLVFPDGILQNGPDAVALYAADGSQFPTGTSPRTADLIDAIVYGDRAGMSPTLLGLLLAGQNPVDEGARGAAADHSLQRCPNGTGGQRQTAAWRPSPPTPDKPNVCTWDTPPSVQSVTPPHGSNGIGRDATLTVTFDEPVALASKWLLLTCGSSGEHAYTTTGGPQTFTVKPSAPFQYSETCTAKIRAARVSDADADDPPDAMAADWSWSFATANPPPNFILINEIDADTPGNDTAEFIELYDGGVGHTRLDGLALVSFNGNGDQSYRAMDLDGLQTDVEGYLVIGNAAVAPDLVFPDGILQNGPDAVALYA
ncbi:MAG: Ig-like domain-containing protein, partial [Candidatus Promineofilum sp.]|nr:Ig-like domain-containing protein [Promineifilum sp.]